MIQPIGHDTRIFSLSNPNSRYVNWVNKITADTLDPAPDSYLISSDTARLRFKGLGINIPLKATVHYEFLERYRLGAGYSYEIMVIGPFQPMTFKDRLTGFQPDRPAGFMRKYFGTVGVSFYRLGYFLFTADANVGGFSPGNNFLKPLIKKGVYANLGITAEYHFSENLRVFARPSFEIKNYTISVPGGVPVDHSFNAFYANVGFTWSIPELPRCYHKDCEAQLNHAHGDREYRSRMHKFWKKQNPMYGENYRKLIKYKGRNKKKLNPY